MQNRLKESNKNYFEILEIEPTTNLDEINRACRKVALKYHPDKGGSNEDIVYIFEIKEKLSNEQYRQEYVRCVLQGETIKEEKFNFHQHRTESERDQAIREFIETVMDGINEVTKFLNKHEGKINRFIEYIKEERRLNEQEKLQVAAERISNMHPAKKTIYLAIGCTASFFQPQLSDSPLDFPYNKNSCRNLGEIDPGLLLLFASGSALMVMTLLFVLYRSLQPNTASYSMAKR